MKKIISLLLSGLILLCLCSCKKENTDNKNASSTVKYSTASIPDYTGTEGDTIDVKLSAGATGNGSAIKKVSVLKSGATVIDISKKSNEKTGSGEQSNPSDINHDSEIEKVNFDYTLNFDTNDIKILQLTDFRIIDSAQKRSKSALSSQLTEKYKISNIESLLFDDVDKLVRQEKPDLILVTGNLVHGQFDDLGTSFLKVIRHMESLNVLWAPVFGDLDGISAQGVSWQCEQLTNAPHCLFKKQNSITGNSNYSIGISVNGKYVRSIYMLDSNSCANTSDPAVSTNIGIDEKQMNWLTTSINTNKGIIGNAIPSFVAFNRPSEDILDALINAEYETPDNPAEIYEIGKDKVSKNSDFGIKGANLTCGHKIGKLCDTFSSLKVDGVFMGANAGSNVSVLYNGIRWTLGSKTGKYDTTYKINGGTKITLMKENNGFIVSNLSVE